MRVADHNVFNLIRIHSTAATSSAFEAGAGKINCDDMTASVSAGSRRKPSNNVSPVGSTNATPTNLCATQINGVGARLHAAGLPFATRCPHLVKERSSHDIICSVSSELRQAPI